MGQPVWLASLSLRDGVGQVVPAIRWKEQTVQAAERVLKRMLTGVGDETKERYFRMALTVCFHRALTDEEVQALPDEFHRAKPVNFAGGPLHIYHEKGVPELPTTRPCRAPVKKPFPGEERIRPDLFLIEDCGFCPPCRARARLQNYILENPWPITPERFLNP